MKSLLKAFAVMTVLGTGSALADEEKITDVAFSDDVTADSCVFETASFDGQVVNGRPQDFISEDMIHEIEEAAGMRLPEGNIDMVKIRYSMCGSGGHEVEEFFDRISVRSLLDDGNTLAPNAVDAFSRAWQQLSDVPCDSSNVEWIHSTIDEFGADVHEPYCS